MDKILLEISALTDKEPVIINRELIILLPAITR